MPGSRGVKAQYRYSDLFRSYLLMTLCGGECAEDITEHLRRELSQVKNFDVCSADTLLRMQKELATEKETVVSETNIRHNFNINIAMNRLMVKLLVQTGQLSPAHEGYIFDYDNQFIPTEKYDSKRSYKKADGYFPGIASIKNYPVYIENRNGNSIVKYKQAETLERAYGLLEESGIKIKHSRMDCGSFDKTVVPVVEANSTYFYIRAQRCGNLYNRIKEITNWETVTIGFKEYQVASVEYAPFGKDKTYRYVITREKNNDAQGNLFHFLTKFISRKLDFIKPNFRLKKFIFRFMVVPAKWIKQGRQYVLKLFISKKYHLLLG